MKLGWAHDAFQRAADSFTDNSHPTELCGKLSLPHFKPLGHWDGTHEEEIALQEQFNDGLLRRKDCANEFYALAEWRLVSENFRF